MLFLDLKALSGVFGLDEKNTLGKQAILNSSKVKLFFAILQKYIYSYS